MKNGKALKDKCTHMWHLRLEICAYFLAGLCLYEGIQTGCDGAGTNPSHDLCRHSQALDTGSLFSPTVKNLNTQTNKHT